MYESWMHSHNSKYTDWDTRTFKYRKRSIFKPFSLKIMPETPLQRNKAKCILSGKKKF